MARLVSRTSSNSSRVYDVAVGGTHSFSVTSVGAKGSVLAHNCHRLSTDALDALLKPQLKKRRALEINKNTDKKVRDEYVELSDDDYKRLLAAMFIEKFPLLAETSVFGRPKLINSSDGDFYEVAKQKLFTIIKPQPQRLKRLASARAQAIATYIVQQAGVPRARVFILDSVIDPGRENNEIVTALSLNAGD